MNLKIAQVVGLNTDQKAAQVASQTRDQDTFLAVLDLTCDDAFTKGRLLLSELEDYYFEFEGSVAEKLNATFKEAQEKFSPQDNFDLSLAAISGKVLYLIGQGGVEVYLKRAGKLSSLLSVGAPSQLISGFLTDGDRLLFSTQSLISFLGEDLEKSLNLPISNFEEEIGSKIGTSDLEAQGLAGLAIEVAASETEIPSLPAQDLDEESPYQSSLSEGSDAPYTRSPLVFKDNFKKVIGVLGKLRIYFPKSGRGRLILAVVLILIIAGGAGYKYKVNKDSQKQIEFNQTLQSAKDNFNAAKGLTSLNPAEAKSKLDLAKGKVNKALSLKSNDTEAQNLKKQIEQDASTILQQASVADFPLFLDLDLVKKNFRASQMSLSKDKLLLLDPAVKTLVVIDLNKKSHQILAGSEQLGEAHFTSLNGGLAFVYSKDKGVLRVDSTNQKITTVSKKDEDFGEIKDIYGFAGNVYLLDSIKNQIWKYLPTSEGYSDKREYLNKGTAVDFTNTLRMQIESSVYVLRSSGEILRFTRGDKDNFSLGGLDKGVKDPKSLFVSSDTDNLYLLDSGNLRLLVLTKTGSYKGQISGDKFGSVTDVVVDEKGKKVYLLEGSKIYSVDLK